LEECSGLNTPGTFIWVQKELMCYQIVDGYIPDIGIAIIPPALFQHLPGIVAVIGISDRRGIAAGKIQGPEVRAQPGFHSIIPFVIITRP